MDKTPQPPHVLVVGGGPVGLEAAVASALAGFAVTLCERSHTVGAAVRDWGHCRLFSSNELNCSARGLQVLDELGCRLPARAAHPTGKEYTDDYLEPLGRWIEQREGCSLRLCTSVVSVSRGHLLKGDAVKATGATERDAAPFSALLADEASGDESVLDGLAAVIDATGTYGNGCSLGTGGAPAVGERALRRAPAVSVAPAAAAASAGAPTPPVDAFFDRLPDVCGLDCAAFLPRFGGRSVRIAVVGGGYSAATTLRALLELAASRGNLYRFDIDWLLRKPTAAGLPYAQLEDDPLPSRGELVDIANKIAGYTHGLGGGGGGGGGCTPGTPLVCVHRGVTINSVARGADGAITVRGRREPLATYPPAPPAADAPVAGAPVAAAAELEPFELTVDTLVSHVGYRPSYDLVRELQVHLCYASEGPMKLASSLLAAKVAASGNPAAAGDCLNQPAAGPELLTTPEPRFYVLGSKSYGRSSSFLLRTGHSQVEAVVGMLVNDLLRPSPPTTAADAADAGRADQAAAQDPPATAAPTGAEADASGSAPEGADAEGGAVEERSDAAAATDAQPDEGAAAGR